MQINMNQQTKGSEAVKYLLIGITVVFLFVMLVLPLAVVAAEALRDGFTAYKNAITDKYTLKAVGLTLEASFFAVVINTIFGIFAAWTVTKFNFRGKKLLTTLIDVPVK